MMEIFKNLILVDYNRKFKKSTGGEFCSERLHQIKDGWN